MSRSARILSRYFNIFFFVFSCCLFLILVSNEISASYPLIRNFTRSDYSGGSQNWCASQDGNGVIYVGNRDGLLQYDSQQWRLYRLPNRSSVRGVYCDTVNNRFYVGGSEEFGYFDDRLSHGVGRYVSLKSKAQLNESNLGEVWNIHKCGNDIWFQSDHYMVRLRGKVIRNIKFHDKIVSSASFGNSLFVATEKGYVYRLDGDKFHRIRACDNLVGKRICSMLLGSDGSLLIGTSFNGIYLYKNRTFNKVDFGLDEFLRKNQLFCMSTDGESLCLGTVKRGAVVVDFKDGKKIFVSKKDGLQNNTVLNVYYDKQHNIWLSLDNGIDYVENNSAIRLLLGVGVPYGAGYCSLSSGNILYLGTNQGLYGIDYNTDNLNVNSDDFPVIGGQIWSLDRIGDFVFVSGESGLFYKAVDSGFKRVDGIESAGCVRGLKNDCNSAIVSTRSCFHNIRRVGDKWIDFGVIPGYNDAGGRFEIDAYDRVWLAHWMKGIYRLDFDKETGRFSSSRLWGKKNCFQDPTNIGVSKIDNKIIFSTSNGYYQVKENSGQIVKSREFDKLFNLRRASHLYQGSDGKIWNVSPDMIAVSSSDKSYVDSGAYNMLKDHIVPGYDHIGFVGDDVAVAACEFGFYEIDMSRFGQHGGTDFPLFLSSLLKDENLMDIKNGDDININYDFGLLRFDFVAPEFRARKGVVYSSFIPGFDKEWSPWRNEGFREISNVKEGDYVLKVKAKNVISGNVKTEEFRFTVLPPFYRTWWAKTIYVIMFFAICYFGLKLLRKTSLRQAEKMEQKKEEEMELIMEANRREALKKDYEIAYLKSQQLEIDVKHKSEELSNTTHNLVRKNQILLQISERLKKLRDNHLSDNERNNEISKINEMIRGNISHDDDWNKFTMNFDSVYSDFLHTLKKKHPVLTQNDLRMCAYLKMGLSTKEIAPLMNISPKSVEMARYRLRKKLELDKDVSLTAYLTL